MPWNDYVGSHRHDIEMDGYRLHYIDIGEGFPIIMLHGYASSGYAYNKNVKAIVAAGYRVILVDLPGQGQSSVPPKCFSPKVENMAGEFIKFVDHLKLDKFGIVGCSMGGGLTLFVTMNFPERIEGAVVIDPAAYDQEKPFHLRLMDRKVAGSIIVQFTNPRAVKRALKDTAYKDEVVTDTFVGEYCRPIRKKGYKTFIGRLVREFPSDLGLAASHNYDRIETPMLIIWGDHDSWIDPKNGERLHSEVKGSELQILEGIGHMPHLEAPEITNKLIIDFFDGIKKNK